MCGLVFIYDKLRGLDQLKKAGKDAVQALKHRGPDDQGLWVGTNCVIGHCRLAIIDLAGSLQPMSDPGGRYVLVYNGEVYNYRELRNELKSEWEFHTQGDTETILAGLVLHGDDFLKKMEGMWAIALWDKLNESLLLSRDRIGKKPLFYSCDSKGMCCASELNALAKLRKKPWSEDLDSTADYLRYGYYLPGTTAYREVQEVLPGHFLRWSPGKPLKSLPYWGLPHSKFSGSKTEAENLLKDSLMHAIKSRMVADVEVGAFLSGGIDSSLVVSILSQELGVRVKTFTIGFEEESFDERFFARRVAEINGTEHIEGVLNTWNRDRLIELVLRYTGQPFADVSLLPTSMVSELASSRLKVVLSGDGGDEMFCGYQRYMARTIMRWYSRLPKALHKGISTSIRALPEPMGHHSRSVLKKAHLFLDIFERRASESPYVAPLLYADQSFSELAPELVDRGHRPPQIPEETVPDDLIRMMMADSLVYLPQDILVKVDRATMAHSLEARAPFLDREVVELALSMPIEWHQEKLKGKRMLYETFQSFVPESIWQRRKQGFGVPIHSWFRGDLDLLLRELLENVRSVIAVKPVKKMLQQHLNGSRDNGYRLWNIFIYFLWLDRNQCLL